MRRRTAALVVAALAAAGLAAPARALPWAGLPLLPLLPLPVAAPGDTAATGSGLSGLVQQQQKAAADSSAARADTTGGAGLPWLINWTRAPGAKVKADVRAVLWEGRFNNALVMRDQSKLIAEGSWSSEEYRRQDKTVESRSGFLRYDDTQDRRLALSVELNDDWTEDRTVNLTGLANVNKREFKRARVTVDSLRARTGGIRHSLRLGGRLEDQRGSSLGVRNDFREGTFDGRFASRCSLAEGVAVVASIYGEKTSGERTLGEETQSSATTGDTLGTWVGWKRGRVSGSFDVRSSAFDKEYLDFRRNANGVVDTLGAVEKIVRELEQQDAVKLTWRTAIDAGRVRFNGTADRTVRRNSFRASGVGEREDQDSSFDLTAAWNAPADSLSAGYGFSWRWDDQTYKNATSSRGRQYRKRRDADIAWTHRLFANTRVRTSWQTTLQQEIAQRRFNENDRDRYETNFSSKLETNWRPRFRTSMTFAYRHVEEISIRRTRSANNNVKDTYEIAPGYYWPVASWLKFQQDYRLSIQYTDYLFTGLPGVNARDDYNKRGTLNTKVTVRPNERLTLTVGHDWNVRTNATRRSTDAAGNSTYGTDLDQRISTLNFGLTYVVSGALTLQGATERSKDEKETFGTRGTLQDRRGRELRVGAIFKKSWQGRLGNGELSGRLSRNFAEGPNVQPANADYWDADVSVNWSF